MNKKYIVRLTSEERTRLQEIVSKGKTAAYKMKHAHVLLKADANDANWSDEHIAEALSMAPHTVRNVRQRFVEQGFEAALGRTKRVTPPRKKSLDGHQEARLMALRCSEPPVGFARWTLHLLAEKLVELHVVESISHETIRQTLKKNELKPHLREYWCIPPKHSAEFVAAMEAILDVYCLPYNPNKPIICMDEKPIQLVKDVRSPLPACPGKPIRYDYEYERNGTANIFLFTEPLESWRKVDVRERRTGLDWAEEIKELLDHDYPEPPTIGLVCDNLNTHKAASLYERFPPAEARQLAKRLEFHYTPKHGSWLNIAECELSVFAHQCLERRIPDVPTLGTIGKTWAQERNGKQQGVDWHFTTEDARIKLKSLYPQIKF